MLDVFVIPLWADLLAVGIGALQGALFAAQFRDRRLDWLGVAIIGIAVGFGGGLVRDLLLNAPLANLQTNLYVVVGTGAALLGMLLKRLFARLNKLITVLDALTIGLFGAIGTTKALSMGLPEVAAVFVGVFAAVGGSILRDLLLNLPIALMHVGSLYAVAAAVGSISIAGLLALDVAVPVAASIGVGVTFAIRIASVLFGWGLPEQRSIDRLPRLPKLPRLPLSGRQKTDRPRTVTTNTGVIHLLPTTASIPVVQGSISAAVAPSTPSAAARRRSPIPGASRTRP